MMLNASWYHTLLRLPTGIFYKQGVKANVLFFDKHKPREDGKPWTKALWIYDFRTNKRFTLKKNALAKGDLDEFIGCFNSGAIGKREESERFRSFSYEDLIGRDKTNLDIFWLKDDDLEDVDSLPAPDILAAEIVENLQEALTHFQEVAEELA